MLWQDNIIVIKPCVVNPLMILVVAALLRSIQTGSYLNFLITIHLPIFFYFETISIYWSLKNIWFSNFQSPKIKQTQM